MDTYPIPQTEKRLRLFIYNTLQADEILSEKNFYHTWEEKHHDPSPNEAGIHYVCYGGAESFNQRFGFLLDDFRPWSEVWRLLKERGVDMTRFACDEPEIGLPVN